MLGEQSYLGKHYCKVCWPKRHELLFKCNFCFTFNTALTIYSCRYKRNCMHRTMMCSACFNIHNCGVCLSCWFSKFKRGCFKCGELIVHSLHVRRRFCRSCAAEAGIQHFANDSHLFCSLYKGPSSPFLQLVKYE